MTKITWLESHVSFSASNYWLSIQFKNCEFPTVISLPKHLSSLTTAAAESISLIELKWSSVNDYLTDFMLINLFCNILQDRCIVKTLPTPIWDKKIVHSNLKLKEQITTYSSTRSVFTIKSFVYISTRIYIKQFSRANKILAMIMVRDDWVLWNPKQKAFFWKYWRSRT